MSIKGNGSETPNAVLKPCKENKFPLSSYTEWCRFFANKINNRKETIKQCPILQLNYKDHFKDKEKSKTQRNMSQINQFNGVETKSYLKGN